MSAKATVTHQAMLDFFSSRLHITPELQSSLVYHVPYNNHSKYNPSKLRTNRLVLSLTPTLSCYERLDAYSTLFLHRPFHIDRRQLPNAALVVASHEAYDANLTVGWNTTFAHLIGVSDPIVLNGYKGDDERCIGLIGRLRQPLKMSDFIDQLLEQYSKDAATIKLNGNGNEIAQAFISLNAFNEEIVNRVLSILKELEIPSSSAVILTGAERQSGAELAKNQKISILAVGHHQAEIWGLKYLAEQARIEFGNALDVQLIDEPELKQTKSSKQATRIDE